MKLLLFILEFVLALMLIGAVLLHSPKGEGLAGIGGQANVFRGQKGMESGLDKATTIIAALFLGVALILGYIL